MSKYNQAIDFCKALRDMLIVHFGDQSVMTQDCKIVFDAMRSMKTHIAELEYLVEAQKASNLKLCAALNESEAKLRELEALKADLKHTEECCVLWATDYGNALKEVEALKADASTARTYMDGYSDGKQWALEEAEKVCKHMETAIDGGGNTYYRPADARQCVEAIRKLKGSL